MGLFNRLFGNGAGTSAPQPVPPAPEPKAAPQPQPVPPAPEPKAAPQPQPVPPAPASAPKPQPTAQPAQSTERERPVEAAQPPSQPEAVHAGTEPPMTDAALQRRLDTYFARLRQEFPDGRIVRLNTGHKKLAERGAELRRLTGYEGRLDEFFALGGFTYQRSAGGRPPLPAEQTDTVEQRLRERFPDDVPTALAVREADPRLYLDLRAVARREGCTVGAYLNQFREE